MHIVVYEKMAGAKGVAEERPLAFFTNPLEARVFLNMVLRNGRTAFSRVV